MTDGEKAGYWRNVRCRECGKRIPLSTEPEGDAICTTCLSPGHVSVSDGGTGHYHCDDDPSGGSASWDMAVDRMEAAQ